MSLGRDAWHAFRQMRRYPGPALTAVASMALGIGAATAVYSVIHGVVLDPFPYRDVSTLMSIKIWEPGERGYRTGYNVDQFLEFRRRADIFTGLTVSTISNVAWTGADQPQRLRGNHTTFDGLEIMGVAAHTGRIFTRADEANEAEEVCVLGYRFWQRQFGGDPLIVGRRMTLNGKVRTVVGIMPPRFMWRGADVYLPLRFRAGQRQEGVWFVHVLGRLKPGVTEARAETNLRSIIDAMRQRDPAQFPEKYRVGLLTFSETFPSGIRQTLWILFAAVGLLLAIACANVSNLLLSRALARQKEMAVRASLGAGRARLISQLLAESLITGLTGGTLGILLAWLGTKAILQLTPPNTIPDESEVVMNIPVLLFSLAVSLATGLLFGLAPAWQGSRTDLNTALRETSRGASAGRRLAWLRGSLVAGEVALSVMLLAGAGVMVRSMANLTGADTGVRTEGILALEIPFDQTRYPKPEARARFMEDVLRRVESAPGVAAAGVNSWYHPFSNFGAPVIAGAQEKADARRVTIHLISPRYLDVYGISLRRGRRLDQNDIGARRMVALVSERFVQRYLGGQAGPGATVRIPRVKESPLSLPTDSFEIVGVVADTNGGNWREPAPEIYLPHSLGGVSDCVLIRVSAGDPMSVLPFVRAAVRELDKDQPIMDPSSLDQLVARYIMARPRFNLLLFGLFASLGLLLALVGVYGVMSAFVAQREQEIGVRIALGASTGGVLRWVLRSSGILIGVGLVIGIVGAALSGRALSSIVWNASVSDWRTLAVVASLMAAAGLLAAAIPARRAARTDPISVLRRE